MVKRARELRQRQTLTTITIDPGFSACGYGIIQREQGVDTVRELGVFRTKKSPKKMRVLQNEDNFSRAREIGEGLYDLFHVYDIDVITFEAFSLPQKGSKPVIVKMTLPYGLLAMLSVVYDVPVVMCTPQHVKKIVCGRVSASKEQVREVMIERYKEDAAIERFRSEYPASLHEHAFDALAVYVASESSDVMKALKKKA